MTDTFRDLCAELLDELDFQTSHHELIDLKGRARAALAVEAEVGLSDSEIDDIARECVNGGKSVQWAIRTALAHYTTHPRPIPVAEWSEDDGDVLWWRLPVEEPPYVGSPLCDDWEPGYYTHFTRLQVPAAAIPLPQQETTNDR